MKITIFRIVLILVVNHNIYGQTQELNDLNDPNLQFLSSGIKYGYFSIKNIDKNYRFYDFDGNILPKVPEINIENKDFSCGWKPTFRGTTTKLTPNHMGMSFVNVDKEYIDILTNYLEVDNFRECLAKVKLNQDDKRITKKNANTGFINSKGEFAIPPSYYDATSFKNGFSLAYELINTKFNVAMNGKAIPKNIYKYRIIDKTGSILFTFPKNSDEMQIEILPEGLIKCFFSKRNSSKVDYDVIFYDKYGQIVYKKNCNNFYDKIIQIFEGDKNDGKVLINDIEDKKSWIWQEGKPLKEIDFNNYIGGFFDDLALVKKSFDSYNTKTSYTKEHFNKPNEIGYSDINGKIVIPFKYSNGSNFYNHRAIVTSNELKYILIDKQDKVIETNNLNF